MKPHFIQILTVLLAGVLLLSTTSCEGPSFMTRNTRAIETLELEVDQLKTSHRTVAQRVGFWQAVAAVGFVLSGFALVGGAALGSRARRERDRSQGEGQNLSNPAQPAR